jgi:hypothetical protein
MPSTSGDSEIQAIEQVIGALDPLDADARTRVLEYAFKRLGINGFDLPTATPAPDLTPSTQTPAPVQAVADIRTLREEKQPKSANEMAAVAGYYLSEVAPEHERKTEIGTSDIERLFKQAQHRLPEAPGKTLPNAAAAGYFDSAGRGLYTLNPVGHNLVAHSLPRSSSNTPSRPRRARTSKSKAKTKPKSTRKGSSGTSSKRNTKRKSSK